MSKYKFISIKSVLYDLSTSLPETEFDENKFLEWATIGFRKLNTPSSLETTYTLIPLEFHKAQLPSDLVYINQIAYNDECCNENQYTLDYFKEAMNLADAKWNPALNHMEFPENLPEKAAKALRSTLGTGWKPMYATTNPFHRTIDISPSVYDKSDYRQPCPDCPHEYSVDHGGCLTTTLADGVLLVSYQRYMTDRDGVPVIPDHEDLKEAILQYVMYRYWQVKYFIKEEGAERRMQYALQRYQMLLLKAKNLDLPDLATMENIKTRREKLIPSTHEFERFFSTLNKKESESEFYNSPGYLRREQ